MQNSKRQLVLSSVLVMLLYVVPNLVQDIHSLGGHQIHFGESHFYTRIQQLYSQQEYCPVCVFEFNIVEQTSDSAFYPIFRIAPFVFGLLHENQVQRKAFNYCNLRGPPQV